MRKYYSLNDLDKKLEEYLDFDNGFFVELGANNGIDQSNTYYYEKFRNWRGVLIEPVPHNYFLCKANRAPENAFSCSACVSFDYTDDFVPIAYSNLMSTSMNTESDVENPIAHAAMGSRFLASHEEVVVFGARARTLNSILAEAKAPARMDLLSLDVEGAEIEVLKGLDHSAFTFAYMCIECRNIGKMEKFLKKHRYTLIKNLSEKDYIFAYT